LPLNIIALVKICPPNFTLIHEGMHATDPYWTRQADARAQPNSSQNHDEIGNRTAWEMGVGILDVSPSSRDMLGNSSEAEFSRKMWGLGTVTMIGANKNPNSMIGDMMYLYGELYPNGHVQCECVK